MPEIEITHCHTKPHIGETLTANYLRHNLPSGVVLLNYHLPDGAGTLEIDAVVLNHNGVYLLEVKHWYGAIEADQTHWRHSSGNLRPSPIPGIEQKAKIVNGFLKDRGWHNISVTGLVVLSKGTGALRIDDPQAHKVFGLHDSLIAALTGRDYVFHPNCRILSGSEVDRLRRTFHSSHVAGAERRVAGYRIVAEYDRGLFVELIAEDPEFDGRRVRIKQYDVQAAGSARELQAAAERFKRDMAALFQAGFHPHLVLPHRFLRDGSSDERYYLILDWAGDHTLATRLAAGSIEPAEQLHILVDAAAALDHCHAHGVVHRNLTPASIYLAPNGPVKVGDFDFARVPAISKTLAATGHTLVTGRHVPPEQAFHASNVDARADIYALGAVWYDMLFRPAAGESLDRVRIDDAPISEDGRDFLRSMLAEDRCQRPGSMADLRECLAILAEELP